MGGRPQGGADRCDATHYATTNGIGSRIFCPAARAMSAAQRRISDAVKVLEGQAESAALPSLLNAALAHTNLGNMQGLIDKLQQSGLGPQVTSWLGAGQNLPITADDLKAALGNAEVQQIAAHFGLPVDKILATVAENLPAIIDKLSPNGTLQKSA